MSSRNILNTHATHQWLKSHVKHSLKKGAGKDVQLPAAQLQELRKIFDLIDEDGSGSIDPTELRDAFSKVGMRAIQSEDVIKTLQRSRKQELTFEDFAASMTQVASAEFKSLQEEQRASSAFTQLQEFAVLQERKKTVREIQAGKPASEAYAKFRTLFEGYPESDIPRQEQVTPEWVTTELRLTDDTTVLRPDLRWKTWRRRRFTEGHTRLAVPSSQSVSRKSLSAPPLSAVRRRSRPRPDNIGVTAALMWQHDAGRRSLPTRAVPRAQVGCETDWSRARWPGAPLQSQKAHARVMAPKPFVQQRREEQDVRKQTCGLRQWKRPGPFASGFLVPLKCTAVAQNALLQPFLNRPEMMMELPGMVLPPKSSLTRSV